MRTDACRFHGRTASFLLVLVSLLLSPAARSADSEQVKKLFASPTREYSTAPLWVWNDMLTPEQIRQTMQDLASQQVKQVFVHPRPGLMTPYLGKEWFKLWKVALKEAKELDMNAWIYDENSYPSGFAGGWVPEAMPEARGRGLELREVKDAPAWSTNRLAVFRLEGDKAEDVSAQVKAGKALPQGQYLSASIRRSPNSPWHGNRSYVDLLYPGVTEKFLEVTLEPYRREFGKEFGQRIPGAFTDEPNIRPAGGWPWTEDLPKQFELRWGYNLLDHLPSLSRPVGDWRKVRHNYFKTLSDLFIERWAKPYYEYCRANNLEFTGHYWDHEWPNCMGVPDNMAMYAWHQRPAIDCLMNQYREDTHAQFGNVRMVKELSSVANQLGKKRTLCEIYGAGGWDLRFEDMKRIGDWLAVLGVNTMDEHLSYITLRGARKRDHPQSFSYHEPWWEAYHVNASYLARVSVALSQGAQINRILVIEPTTTAWMYQEDRPKLKELGDSFFKLLMTLEAAHWEYDLGCEDIIAREGSVVEKDGLPKLKVGQRIYYQVILPEGLENIDGATAKLLQEFIEAEGLVSYFPGQLPTRIDGAPSGKLKQEIERRAALPPSDKPGSRTGKHLRKWDQDSPAKYRLIDPSCVILRDRGQAGILFHHRRVLDDGQILFLVNSSIDSPCSGRVDSALNGCEEWNLYSGETKPYAFEKTGQGMSAKFDLPPCGSLLLFLSAKTLHPAPAEAAASTALPASGPMEIRRLEPNVFTLDYVDIRAGGEDRTNLYFYQAGQFAFQKNGLERNPWDSAVQFKEELIKVKFPARSGFAASYWFNIEGVPPPNLAVVIERPDLYTINCNGLPVTAKPGEWWLDKAFGKIDISSGVRSGANVITIKASPFTIYHELEPAYLLGDFALKPSSSGFTILREQALKPGKWNDQGCPFYGAGVAYRQSFNLNKLSGQYRVALSNWHGSVAKVRANGYAAGYITARPWHCDVTKFLKPGANTIEVEVIGTLKNTLGPHHNKPGLGSAWPGMFQKGPIPGPPPGDDYNTVGYGLFEPFALEQVTR